MQKTDLIAELKKTKDIPGIKKLKVERAKVEKTQEQNMITEISKAFSVSKFVDQVSPTVNSIRTFFLLHLQFLHLKKTFFNFFSPSDLSIDPREGQLGQRDSNLEATDARSQSRRTCQEGIRGTNR